MQVIGLLGRAGSGKTTVAQHLVNKHNATIFSFAGPIKSMAIEIMEFSVNQVYGPQAIKDQVDCRYGMSPRKFMQKLGASARMEMGKDIWIWNVIRQIKNHKGLCVVDDVRYPNESELLSMELGASIFKLICTDGNCERSNHESESAVDSTFHDRYLSGIISCPRSPGAKVLIEQFERCSKGFLP